jgi:two-component system sensor histidine kinase RegB
MGAAASPAEVNFAWLIRLRWATIAAQAVTIAIVRFGLQIDVPIGPLYAICAVAAAVNLGFALGARTATPRESWLLAVVAVDVVSLTGLLYFAGGPENPFSFLYLVPIAVGAITLRPASTWVLVLLSMAASAVLFTSHRPLALGGDHAQHMAAHLRGMWIAFGIAAAFIVYFLMRVRRALALRDEELAASRNLAARQERLASLATLAAGAAHELATPLSTIAVVAKDLERDVAAAGVGPNAADDVRLMRREVDRCRRILERMRVDAGESAGERFVPVAVRDLVSDCLGSPSEGAGPASAWARSAGGVDVDIAPNAAALTAVVPRRAFGQVLRGLLDNGAGIPADLLGRVGEPFFTTKPPGKGMGLGVFLARAVVERLGGEVAIQSARGVGTTATVSLPLEGDG